MLASANKLQSQVISFLRFPLTICIVLIHLYSTEYISVNQYPFYTCFLYFVSRIFSRIAVPLFFIFSGYLFFLNIEKFESSIYLSKVRKRVRSLLVPLLFWNLCYILLKIFGDFFTGAETDLCINWSLYDWCYNIWNPISYQFWFLRDLFLMVLCTPIIYYIIKHKCVSILFFLSVSFLWFFFDNGITNYGFSLSSVLFFTLGSLWGIKKINFLRIHNSLYYVSIFFYLISSILILVFLDYDWCIYVKHFNILIGILIVLKTTALLLEKFPHLSTNKFPFISNSHFFIYCYHVIFLTLLTLFNSHFLYPKILLTDFSLSLIYIIQLLLTIIVGVLLYNFLKHFCPKFTSIILGSR